MRAPPPQLPLFPDGNDSGHLPGFSVRKSTRAKRLTIKVFPRGRVEVVVPHRTRAADVQAFVNENATWIRDARSAFAVEHSPEAFALPRKIPLPGIGRTADVEYRHKPGAKTVRARSTASGVALSGRVDDEALCVAALRRWLCSAARTEFEPRLRTLSATMRTPYTRMQVRAQRTCWGSRSSSGTVSLNFCLLFLEPELVRYLMIHELAHGRHMNHSRRFWNLVARFEPAWGRLDRALTDSWRAVPP
ncbi:MAG TPA: SprT family zinc-dependent metalloprotease, partial [Woeseiaceae bacterium]|nr:SprT family zinc-dependent metalloprotease [Woeseiaceae bacterium]